MKTPSRRQWLRQALAAGLFPTIIPSSVLGKDGAVRVSPQLLDQLREDPAVRKVKLAYSPPWAN